MVERSKFPPGWDEERVRKVLAHYEEQAEDEAVAEDEAGAETSSEKRPGRNHEDTKNTKNH